jgi:hypothetical protein
MLPHAQCCVCWVFYCKIVVIPRTNSRQKCQSTTSLRCIETWIKISIHPRSHTIIVSRQFHAMASFILRQRATDACWIRGWFGPRVILKAKQWWRETTPCGEWKPGCLDSFSAWIPARITRDNSYFWCTLSLQGRLSTRYASTANVICMNNINFNKVCTLLTDIFHSFNDSLINV